MIVLGDNVFVTVMTTELPILRNIRNFHDQAAQEVDPVKFMGSEVVERVVMQI